MREQTNRRAAAFPFYLVGAGCLIAVVALWIAKSVATVHDRQALLDAVEADGGFIGVDWGSKAQAGFVRSWFGDRYVNALILTATQEAKYKHKVHELFPEARITVFTDEAFSDFLRRSGS